MCNYMATFQPRAEFNPGAEISTQHELARLISPCSRFNPTGLKSLEHVCVVITVFHTKMEESELDEIKMFLDEHEHIIKGTKCCQ